LVDALRERLRCLALVAIDAVERELRDPERASGRRACRGSGRKATSDA
jgi:DNA-binding CsgD family transcriptional regulator